MLNFQSFYPNSMSKIQESDSENGEVESRLMEAKKPFLLHYNDEEILLNFM